MLENDTLSMVASIPTPNPPVPVDEVFTSEQWTTLLAICEVFLPNFLQSDTFNIPSSETWHALRKLLPVPVDESILSLYLSETVAGNEDFRENIRQRFAGYVPKAQAQGLAFLLSALDTRVGSLAMTGSVSPIHTRTLAERARIVFNWADSYIGPLRALYQACESLTKATWVAQSTTLHKLLDFPKVPKNLERHPSYDFKFLDFSDSTAQDTIRVEADVVIVGSGCGSGVMAEHLSGTLKNLSSKPKILVLEKGFHFPSSHFPMDASAAGVNTQESGGGILSDDGSVVVVAGNTWGGGGTINWSASLQPQRFVREEWATKHKLPFVIHQDFQACLDEVCDKMGVCHSTDLVGLSKIEHNFANSVVLEGSRRLGLKAEVVPQNTAGKHHFCGRCGLGCASATKQGPANFWLPAAARNGVEFIEGCFVENITWDTLADVRRATGVKAVWTSRARDVVRKLSITAKHVVVSSGTLHSPLLLQRSGLGPEVNRNIGSNLHLHPTLIVRGTYPERVDPWDGAILTSVMTSLENLDGRGHGPKVEVLLGVPEVMGSMLPFRPQLSLRALAKATSMAGSTEDAALMSALDYRTRVAKHAYSFGLIAIQRDHADDANPKQSYVYNDRDDITKIKISYTPSAKDRECLIEGAITAARMHYVMGAGTIEPCAPSIELFERPSTRNSLSVPSAVDKSVDDVAFEAWISNIKSKGISLIDTRNTRLGSAHQMSTCRMSATPEEGVVDLSGKVWGTENVYVADASILPSASGVNPMISTMGFSLHVAKGLADNIRAMQ